MRTIVGLYDTFSEAQAAVRDLEASGFGPNDINVLAHGDAVLHGRGDGTATGAGTAIGAGLGLLAGLSIVAVPGIGAVAALGPILAGGILGAVAGGLVGSLVDAGVPMDEAEFYAEGVRRGGTLVTVAASDDNAPRVIEILTRHNPVNLNERVMHWRQSGWTPGGTTGADKTTAPANTPPTIPTTTASDRSGSAAGATMGDAAREAPTLEVPPATPVLGPAPDLQPTREAGADKHPIPSSVVGVTRGDEIFSKMESDFRDDFDRHFPGGDYSWDECGPAYRHGCGLACECDDPKEWADVERDAKVRWERTRPGTWDRVKDAARYGYDRARSKV